MLYINPGAGAGTVWMEPGEVTAALEAELVLQDPSCPLLHEWGDCLRYYAAAQGCPCTPLGMQRDFQSIEI